MRTGITVSPINRQRLTALVRDRNALQKHVWRAAIILLSADGVGTVEIIKAAASKPMPVLSFLEGEGREAAGWLIGEILALNDHQLERRHDFIQWLFALPEPSRAQAQSPILTPAEITAIR